MRSIVLLAAAAGLAAGCNHSLPAETDPSRGREALRAVLDAWKAGQSAESLKTSDPPVTARDPDWSAGAKLVRYEIADADARAGVDLLLTVKLALTRPDGRSAEKQVSYIVAVGRSTVVVRNE